MTTFWQVPSCPRYRVDLEGRVLGPSGRILKPSPNRPDGYLQVTICYGGGIQQRKYVHLLVLETFDGPCPPGMEGRHRNGNRLENRWANLEYGTHQANEDDKVRHGTAQLQKTHCQRGHAMTPDNVIHGKKQSGKPRRSCRKCHNAAARVSRKALRDRRREEMAA